MSNMNKVNKFILIIFVLATSINMAWACGHPPPIPPNPTPEELPKVWMIDHGIDPTTGKSNMWFGVEIDPVLFSVATPTVCTCGIGIGGLGLPFVASLVVTDAMLAVTNLVTHVIDPLEEFDFTADPGIAADASANALISGQQWTGFSALVNNFVQPIFAPDEVLKLWFNLEIDPADISILRDATANQLVGFTIGGDPNNPLHAPQQFNGFKEVPEPATALIFAFGLALLSRRKLIQRS